MVRWSDADDAMATLARERGRALVGYAFLLCGDLREAEDLVQEALARTFARSRRIDPEAVEGYVRRVILSVFIDAHRRRRLWAGARHLLVREDQQPGPKTADGVDLRDALAQLPPQQRACVVLRYYEDLTVADVAARMGLGVGTVKRYLSLAVRRLETILGPVDQVQDVTVVEGGSR